MAVKQHLEGVTITEVCTLHFSDMITLRSCTMVNDILLLQRSAAQMSERWKANKIMDLVSVG